jgi:hypothetical protein
VLALFLPNPGDVLDGSKRVKDFAVCTADGRDFIPPVETFLDISDMGELARGGTANIQGYRQMYRTAQRRFRKRWAEGCEQVKIMLADRTHRYGLAELEVIGQNIEKL